MVVGAADEPMNDDFVDHNYNIVHHELCTACMEGAHLADDADSADDADEMDDDEQEEHRVVRYCCIVHFPLRDHSLNDYDSRRHFDDDDRKSVMESGNNYYHSLSEKKMKMKKTYY